METQKKKGFASLFEAQDMTVGSPLRNLVMFSIPLLIGNIAQMLYNTVDSIVVGKYCGDAALSAIGASAPLQNMFIVFFMAIGAGVMVMVSQYFGAKEYDKLTVSIGNSITMILIVSVFITAVATPLTPTMLKWMKTPAETFDMAKTYLSILFIGIIGNGFYNILSAVLRGLGESLFPFFVLVGCSLLNVGLDLLFVAVFNMGIGGAAWATIISQILSSVVCIIKVLKMKGYVMITKDSLRLRKSVVVQMMKLGIPGAMSQCVIFISSLFIQSLVNQMGYIVAASITAMARVDAFAILPSQSFANAASTYTGQNIGAGRMDRVIEGRNAVLKLCGVVTCLMVAVLLVFGRSLIGLFTDTAEVMDLGVGYIRVMACGYIVMVIGECLPGIMRGAGDTVAPMMISLIANVAIRVPLAYILTSATRSEKWPNGQPNMLYVSLLCTLILSTLLSLFYYRRGKWKTKAIVGDLKVNK